MLFANSSLAQMFYLFVVSLSTSLAYVKCLNNMILMAD